MTKYLLVYSGGSMPETDEESVIVMRSWQDWFASLGDAVADAGNPIGSPAKKVAPNGAASVVPENELASGYSILEANSLDEAVKYAQACPVLAGGGQIHVFETFELNP